MKTSIPQLHSFTPKSTGKKIRVINPSRSQRMEIDLDYAVVIIEHKIETGNMRFDTACYILDAAKHEVMNG